MEINRKVLDELIKDYKKPEDLIGETGLLKQLTKALIERALDAELTQHLGYEKQIQPVTTVGTRAMGPAPKRCRASLVKSPSRRRAIATPVLSLRF
jgi:putative transposase